MISGDGTPTMNTYEEYHGKPANCGGSGGRFCNNPASHIVHRSDGSWTLCCKWHIQNVMAEYQAFDEHRRGVVYAR